jgi:hypothetical protein
MKKKQWRDFESARKFVQSLNLKNQKEWEVYCKLGKKPKDIPAGVSRTYKNKGWVSWGDFLGTGRIYKKEYWNFKQCKSFIIKLNLENRRDFLEWHKKNKTKKIPADPDRVFKKTDEWKGWGDWLGTGRIANQDMAYRDLEQSKKFVHTLYFKSKKEWFEYCKSGNKPDDIPSYPDTVYSDKHWIGWSDWLGNEIIASYNKKFLSYVDAQKFVQSLQLKGQQDWQKYCKSGNKPDDISSTPDRIYKNNGWNGYGDWLGTGRIANPIKSKNYLPWPEAKKIYRKLAKKYELKNGADWKNFIKLNKQLLEQLKIPAHPNQAYLKNNVWRRRNK